MKTSKEERDKWVKNWKPVKTQFNSKIAYDIEELEAKLEIAKEALESINQWDDTDISQKALDKIGGKE